MWFLKEGLGGVIRILVERRRPAGFRSQAGAFFIFCGFPFSLQTRTGVAVPISQWRFAVR